MAGLGSWGRHDLQAALQAADAAVWTLLERAEQRTLSHEHTGWDRFDGSPLTRAEVHQATGMLSVQADLAVPAALARLRAAAFGTGRAIAEPAAEVVAPFSPGADAPGSGEPGSKEDPA